MSRVNQGDLAEGFVWPESQPWGFLNSLISDEHNNEPICLSFDNNKALVLDEAKGAGVAAPAKPPSAAPIKNQENNAGTMATPKNHIEGKVGSGGEMRRDQDVHIFTERERRKKMRNMFSTLQALLPQLPPKVDKATAVDEAVNYIKTLEITLEKLNKQKLDMLQSASSFTYDQTLPQAPIQKLPYNSREAFLADHGATVKPSESSIIPKPPPTFQTWTSPSVVINVCGDIVTFNICSLRRLGALSGIMSVMEKHKLEVVTIQASSDSLNQHHYMVQAHVKFEPAHDQMTESYTVEDLCKQAAEEMTLWTSAN